MTSKPLFFSIQFSNQEELLFFLEKENNSYSKFIFEKIKSHLCVDSINLPENFKQQIHHIQPKYANGSNEPWNLVKLSVKDHAEAHRLLYECYNNAFDLCAFYMMNGQSDEALAAMRKQNQVNMKQRKVGFYNSDLQRQLGRRPKRRKPYARNLFILNALKKGFILESIETKEQIVMEPFECSSLQEAVTKWMAHPEMESKRKAWLNTEEKKRSQFYEYTALTRILTGHQDKKTKKVLYSVSGWRVLGIFCA